MVINDTFIVKRTVTSFYRVSINGDFVTAQDLEAAIRSSCQPAALRADMPAEEDHFSTVRESDGESPKRLLVDQAKIEAELAAVLAGLSEAKKLEILEAMKTKK